MTAAVACKQLSIQKALQLSFEVDWLFEGDLYRDFIRKIVHVQGSVTSVLLSSDWRPVTRKQTSALSLHNVTQFACLVYNLLDSTLMLKKHYLRFSATFKEPYHLWLGSRAGGPPGQQQCLRWHRLLQLPEYLPAHCPRLHAIMYQSLIS